MVWVDHAEVLRSSTCGHLVSGFFLSCSLSYGPQGGASHVPWGARGAEGALMVDFVGPCLALR